MSTAARLQPESPPQKRVDIPNWLLALIALATIVFGAGAMNARVAALENDHVGKTEVQDIKDSQRRTELKIDKVTDLIIELRKH